MRDKYVYPYSSVEAKRLGELDAWRTSHKLNRECAEAIDKAVREHFDGMNLPGDIAENACKEFGIDRVRWVLANTVQHADWDGRYRPQNKEWAKETYILRNKENGNTTDYILKSHPELVNGLVNQYRRYYDGLGLFNKAHCEESSRDMDYTGRVLVLKPDILRDECKTPEDQLFYANVGGFGCSPGNHGKVIGQFLSDGEETNFHRDDFIGVIKNENLPEWAAKKLEELTTPSQDKDKKADLRVLVVEPHNAPYEAIIPNDTESIKSIIGGVTDTCYPFRDNNAFLIVHDEGGEANRQIGDMLIAGTFIIVGNAHPSGETISLTDEQIARYSEMFSELEEFTEWEDEDECPTMQ